MDDMKDFRADNFQLIEPEAAGYVLLALVVLVVIFESVI